MASDFKSLQIEIGKRLAELRTAAMNGASPETVASIAKERHLKIGARTIREWEAGRGNMQLSTLVLLLSIYDISLGEFFRFDQPNEDQRLISDILLVMKNPTTKKNLRSIINSFRES